ncbi:MAG: histidine kinase [Bacteroidota bacterium]
MKDLKKRSSIPEYWIHIIFWLLLFLFPVSVLYIQNRSVEPILFLRFSSSPVLFYLNYRILVPRFLLKKKISTYIGISLVALVIVNYLLSFLAPVGAMRKFEGILESVHGEGFKLLPYFITTLTTMAFFLLGGLLALVKDFYRREHIQKESDVRRNETELRFLRAQLNPHFLFNSLNSIYSLVRNKDKEAPEAVIVLSEMMRYMLYEAKREEVPLSKEIDYIKNFVALQLFRLSNSENVKLKISGEYNDKKIPPLLLIPFVENAFKYGTDFKGVTYVDVRLRIVGHNLFFHIRNKIGNYTIDDKNSGIGLENIKNRLLLLYPEDHSLYIKKEKGFYIVELEIYLKEVGSPLFVLQN